ncbi:MAG: methylenetetrahydrofolate reductase [NAD(P)H] [Deltaproteobacteria bacterium]
MRIKDIFDRKKFSLSFEVFPPTREGNIDTLFTAIQELQVLKPDFISVTYGAGGGTKNKTVEIASKIKKDFSCEVLAHLTCVNSTATDITKILDEFVSHGIENILALRGDPPHGEGKFKPTKGGFNFANELTDFINKQGTFCVGVAGYPEKHPDASSMLTDIKNLKKKVDAGADFITTQLFFDNDDFYRFVELVRAQGITVPIIPGIFPALNYKQIIRISELCGAKIPVSLGEKMDRLRDKPEETEKYGIEYAIRQAEALVENAVTGLHFYTMNKSNAVIEIVSNMRLSSKRQ